MPFKSEKQRKWMHINNPEMAKKWEKKEKKMKETKVRQLIKKLVREIMDEGGPGSGPQSDDDNPFDREPSDDELKDIEKQFEGFLGGLNSKSARKSFDNKRKKQSEVLGYKLADNSDVRINNTVVGEGKLTEINFDKVAIPAKVKRYLIKLVDSMKDENLNRLKRSAILYRVIDAAGMSPETLMKDIQKIKKSLKKEGKLSEKGIGASNYKGFWDSVDKSVGPKVKKSMPWAKGKDLGAIYYLIWMVTDFKTLHAIHSKSPGKFKKWIKSQAKDGKYLKEGKLTEGKGVDKVLDMADNNSFGKLAGKTVDAMSANLFKQVYEKSGDTAKAKIDKMNEKQIYNLMIKIWNKFGKQVRI